MRAAWIVEIDNVEFRWRSAVSLKVFSQVVVDDQRQIVEFIIVSIKHIAPLDGLLNVIVDECIGFSRAGPKMREAMGYATKAVSDHSHKDLHPDEIFNLFKSTFENVVEPYSINEVHFQQKDGGITTQVTSTFNGKTITTEATGNGRLDAVSNALKKAYEMKFTLVTYQEHALEKSSSSKAIAYVGIQKPDGTLAWGAGVDSDIIRASIDALVTAINNR